jgi:hypothetical protein
MASQQGMDLQETTFDFEVFKRLFSKLASIGLNSLLYDTESNKRLARSLAECVAAYDAAAAASFLRILSKGFIGNASRDDLKTLLNGFSNYCSIFVNLHQYKAHTITTNHGIARTYMADIIKAYQPSPYATDLATICIFLDAITRKLVPQ